MKKIINYMICCFVALAFISCEKNEPILFKDSEAFVAFENVSGLVVEGQTINLRVMYVTTSKAPITLNFDFEVEGIANPAVEDVAFELLNDSKTLSFSEGMGYATISIRAIPDGIFTGNRSVYIVLGDNSGGVNTGTEGRYRLTINDTEHPLNLVLGTYTITGVETPAWWGDPINQTIVTSPVEGDLGKVSVSLRQLLPGWASACADFLVYIDVDLDEMTFNIKAGQEYPSFNTCGGPNYGPSKTTGFLAGTNTIIEDGQPVKFSIASDGTITSIDHFGHLITAGVNTGLYFTVWQSVVWTKGTKNYVELEVDSSGRLSLP